MDKLVYWEIRSMDIDTTSAFFAQLFGWKMQKTSEHYVMFEVEGGISGGIQHIDADPGQGLAVYIGVDDIPATLRKAEKLGGTIVHPKTEIGGDWGYWADFRPPGGCPAIGLWSKT
jgi:predicted enzyme related to lactoylglutathione lyase